MVQVNNDGTTKEPVDNEIAGWFPTENQAKLKELIQEHGVKSVIEIGAFVGKSTAFFAEHCDSVIAVDPFVMWREGKKENGTAIRYGDDFYWQFMMNLSERGLLNKTCPVRLTSKMAARLPNLHADLVYIDAMHDYGNVLADIKRWAPKAKKIICGDDYDIHWPGVKKAVDEMYPEVNVAGNLWWVIL